MKAVRTAQRKSRRELCSYRFENPGRAVLRTKHTEEQRSIDTSGEIWEHPYFGRMDWRRVAVPESLRQAMQHYIFHQLEAQAPSSAFASFTRLLIIERQIDPETKFPLSRGRVFEVFGVLREAQTFQEFRRFYRWCVLRALPGFDQLLLREIERLRAPRDTTRIDARAPGRYANDDEERGLLQAFETTPDVNDPRLRDHVLAQLCWELGCRPEQARSINEHHIHVEHVADEAYAHLEIMRVKQRTAAPEYKRRAISSTLAAKILLLIAQNRQRFGPANPSAPLFRTQERINLRTKHYGQRLRSDTLSRGVADFVSETLGSAGYRGARMFRHNMAQRMADIGAPTSVIAEALDHSDLTSVAIYVRCKPDVAVLKTRALGKSQVYRDVLAWLNGKEPVSRTLIDPSRVVQGIVADRYIGGVGACDLPRDRRCPKNPVYACYGCSEFTPFIDGEHAAVAEAMTRENEQLLEIAGVEGNRVALANEYPISVARAVEALCARKRAAQS